MASEKHSVQGVGMEGREVGGSCKGVCKGGCGVRQGCNMARVGS